MFNLNGDGFDLIGPIFVDGEINFLSGSNSTSGNIFLSTINILNGATLTHLPGGSLQTNLATIRTGGTLDLVGSTLDALVTNIESGGVLSASNGATINGDLNVGRSGGLRFDIAQSADPLTVVGDLDIEGGIEVLTGARASAETITLVDGQSSVTGAFATVDIESGLLIERTVDIDTTNFDVVLTTSFNNASSVAGLNTNQANLGDLLIALLNDPMTTPELSEAISAIGVIPDSQSLSFTLRDLTPEAFDLGLKFLTTAQGRFLDILVSDSATTEDGELIQLASLTGGPVARSSAGGVSVWGASQGYGLNQNGGTDFADFRGTGFSFFAGVSDVNAGPFSFGVAAGYSNFDGDIRNAPGDSVDADLFHVAASVGADMEIGSIAASLENAFAYASGEQESIVRSTVPVSGDDIFRAGEADISSFDWLTRFTVNAASGKNWSLRPYVQGGVNIYSQGAARIADQTVLGVAVGELDRTRWQAGIGAYFEQQIGDRLAFNARAGGIQYFGDTENVFSSRVSATPTNATFLTTGKEIERQAQLDAAFLYQYQPGFELSIGAFGEVGDLSLIGGNVRLTKRF